MKSITQGIKVLALGLLSVGLMSSFSFAESDYTDIDSGSSQAEEGILSRLNVEVSGTVDYYTRYLWRGFTLDNDPVIQPGLSFSAYGFTFNVWSSWDVDSDDDSNSDEIDYTFDYTHEFFDILSVSAGHIYYDFPGTNSYSKEFYLGVGLSKIPYLEFPLSTSLTYYRDYGDPDKGGGHGHYFSFDAAYSHEIWADPSITIDLGGHFGYNNRLFISGAHGYDAGVSLGLTVPLTSRLNLSPTVNYSVPFSELRDADDGNQQSRVYAGIGLSYTL